MVGYLISPETTAFAALPPAQRLAMAQQQLEQQAATPEVSPPAAAPNAQMYGIFGPQYAQALATRTGAAGGDLLRLAGLSNRADAEPARYDAALERAQRGAMALQDRQDRTNILGAILNRDPTPAFDGTRGVAMGPNGPEITYDPQTSTLSNEMLGDANLAATGKDNAAAMGVLHDMGIRIPANVVAQRMMGAGQEQPDAMQDYNPEGYSPDEMNVHEKLPIEQQNADANTTSAAAQQYRAEHGDTTYTHVEQTLPGAMGPTTTDTTRGHTPYTPSPTQGGSGGGNAWLNAQPSPAQQRMMDVAARGGGQASMTPGGILVIVGPAGQRYMIGPDGQQISQGRGGGSPAPSPQNRAGRINASYTVHDRIGAPRDGGRRTHLGYDMFGHAGAPLRVPHDVVVSRPRSGGISGNRVLLTDTATGAQWSPMHLPNFPRNGRYSAGQLALFPGLTGTSGRGTPHIHMQPMNDVARRMRPEDYFGL